MKLKRFQAPDTRQAMQLIRQSLGDDAVILSNSKTPTGVELVAAIDYDTAVIKPTVLKQPISTAKILKDSNLAKVEEEIQMMREMLQDKLGNPLNRQQGGYNPLLHRFEKQLANAGISEPLRVNLLNKINLNQGYQETIEEIFVALAHDLTVSDNDLLNKGGINVFLGPTGVGKTTTIAKLAARYCLRFGSNKLALITTDTYRVAAIEQLKTYANILGVAVELAETPQDLQYAIERNRAKKLVLIDTAGLSIKDERLNQQLNMIASAPYDINLHLVLAATCQPNVMQALINHIQSKRKIDNIITTKIDEATTLGGIISILIENDLPIMYSTNGQRVPEDIQVVNRNHFVRQFTSALAARSTDYVE